MSTGERFRRMARRTSTGLAAASCIASAAGCSSTSWEPVPHPVPVRSPMRLRFLEQSQSSPGYRIVTLYNPWVEGDSVLVGTTMRRDPVGASERRVPLATASLETVTFHAGRTVLVVVSGMVVTFGILPFAAKALFKALP
jgi:hypothetical protein